QRDSGPKKELKNGLTVAPVRLSETKSTTSRSHECDTSNIPGWYGDDTQGGETWTSREEWFRNTMVPYLRRQLPDAQARSVIAGWERGDPECMDLVDAFEHELRQRENRPRYPKFGDAAKAQRIARRWVQ